MELKIAKWFKRNKKVEELSDIERFMRSINADISVDVRSILDEVVIDDEKKLKELYKEIYDYTHSVEEDKSKKKSLIKNRFVLESIIANLGNYEISSKIFDFVKSWDKDTFLPRNTKYVLKSQLGDNEIEQLEDLYKEFNVLKKDRLKDNKYYYYVNSMDAKNELTNLFGDLEGTSSMLVYIKEIDNRRKIPKEIVEHFNELMNKLDFEGNQLNSIRLCKIKNIDNDNVVDDPLIDEIFNDGLINSGDVINESNTTKVVNNIKDLLIAFRNDIEEYDGYIVLELPMKYFKDNQLLPEYENELYKSDTSYLTIYPDYLDSYIAINDNSFKMYTRNELVNKELDKKSKKK